MTIPIIFLVIQLASQRHSNITHINNHHVRRYERMWECEGKWECEWYGEATTNQHNKHNYINSSYSICINIFNKTSFISLIFSAILQRTTVDIGQIKIQGVATCLFLCMDTCGTVYGSVNIIAFTPQSILFYLYQNYFYPFHLQQFHSWNIF